MASRRTMVTAAVMVVALTATNTGCSDGESNGSGGTSSSSGYSYDCIAALHSLGDINTGTPVGRARETLEREIADDSNSSAERDYFTGFLALLEDRNPEDSIGELDVPCSL